MSGALSDPVQVGRVRVPRLIYGTAWKEAATASLTRIAIEAGFRGIDTANQRKHYHEAGVGEAVRDALGRGLVARGDLFLQTKFTYASGQDHRLPYDPAAPIGRQVEQSFERSLQHLGVERLDAYLLHGPSTYPGLGDADFEAWGAMEELQRAGRVGEIGISNVTAAQLEELWSRARVKPRLVQNRTFTRPHADLEVRRFCAGHGLGYEGFSLLTAHRGILSHPAISALATDAGLTTAQLVLRYCLEHGMIVLTGTTDPEHMEQDLAILAADLPTPIGERLDELLQPRPAPA